MKNQMIYPIVSSSRGNSFILHSEGTSILIDAGLSARHLKYALEFLSIPRSSLKAVLITHEHTDHVSGLSAILNRFDIPVYASEKTFSCIAPLINTRRQIEFEPFTNGHSFSIPPFLITPFPVPHDAVDPSGFLIQTEDISIGFALDLGFVSTLVKEYIRGVNLLVIEANHDEEMLMNGPYSWSLKKRIMSRFGHLSNRMAGKTIGELLHQRLERVILAHLSEINNRPDIALSTVLEELSHLPTSNIDISVADSIKKPMQKRTSIDKRVPRGRYRL